MPSKQAILAASAVVGFRFAGPITRKTLGSVVPGVSGMSDDVIGAVAAVAIFMIAKRLLR